MENPNLDETMPSPAHPGAGHSADLGSTQPVSPIETQPIQTNSSQPEQAMPPAPVGTAQKPARMRGWALWGVLGLLVIAILSAGGGYASGISQRKNAESTQVALTLDEQFVLGIQDLEAKRYDLARQRFEYIINANPLYPGVTEKLADTLLALNTKATPTPVASPTPSPTPDLRNVQELFAGAQQDLANSDWSAAIETLLSLRKADPNYQAVWVDGMLYTAFRNRGKDKILLGADLEGGIYDLTVAEQYGLLDVETRGLLNWSHLYITGASFWELDWAQAVYYFAQVAPSAPNLRDGSGWTSTERYRLALIGYGDFLADQGEWCAAYEQLSLALALGPDAEVQEALPEIAQKCGIGGEEDSGKKDKTPTPTTVEATEPPPVEPTPTEEPTAEPPPEPTPTP